jgi:hypothetical protein
LYSFNCKYSIIGIINATQYIATIATINTDNA